MALLLTSCSTPETNPGSFIDKFKKSEADFDHVLKELRNDDLIIGYRNQLKIFRPTDFNKKIENNLVRLGINEFHFYSTVCHDTSRIEIDLTTNWTTAFPVHLCQSFCINDLNIEKAYFKRDNGNEGWGLGDNWVVWFEHSSTKGILTYYDKKSDTLR